MIRIDWQQVQSLHTNLLQKGYTAETIIIVVTEFRNGKSEKMKIELDRIFLTLSEIESNQSAVSVAIHNEYSNMALFAASEEEFCGNSLEIAPVGGHKQVVKDFALNSDSQKEAWVEMTVAAIQEYLLSEQGK
jgi:hypothetical protein